MFHRPLQIHGNSTSCFEQRIDLYLPRLTIPASLITVRRPTVIVMFACTYCVAMVKVSAYRHDRCKAKSKYLLFLTLDCSWYLLQDNGMQQ